MKPNIALSLSLLLVLMVSACAADNNTFDPNTPVDSDQPMPVEPDGGIGGDSDGEKVSANAYVSDAQLLIMESYPVQIALVVSGDLPTPCHEFQYEISEPDAENQIFVEIFSMVNPGEVCIEVLEPFSENISLPVADLPDGIYTIFVNGELVGEFSYPG
jgi:inhibitor of cysteine peptidase